MLPLLERARDVEDGSVIAITSKTVLRCEGGVIIVGGRGGPRPVIRPSVMKMLDVGNCATV